MVMATRSIVRIVSLARAVYVCVARCSGPTLVSFAPFGWVISPIDGNFWQDYRPASRNISRKDRKRARLHRFDSDDDTIDGDQTVKPGEEITESAEEEEDASALESASSSSDTVDNEENGSTKTETIKTEDESALASLESSPPPSTFFVDTAETGTPFARRSKHLVDSAHCASYPLARNILFYPARLLPIDSNRRQHL